MKKDSIIFNLNSNSDLLDRVIREMGVKRHFIEVGKVNIQNFADSETCVNFDSSVRGKRVFLLTTPNTAIKIIQLNLAIDAAKRASASEIIPIIPYFPYSRQDKKDQYRGPIGSKVIAEMIENRGATSIVTFDLHANQIEGFFNIPVIHLKSKYLFVKYLLDIGDATTVLCSPDAGGLMRVKKMKDLILKKYPSINVPYVTIDKTRPAPNQVGEMTIIGNVKGRSVVIIDDLCDTGGTLIKATDALLDSGAIKVRVLVTHPVLSNDAYERITNSNIAEFICSDSIEIKGDGKEMNGKLTIISTANEISNAIISVNTDVSIVSGK